MDAEIFWASMKGAGSELGLYGDLAGILALASSAKQLRAEISRSIEKSVSQAHTKLNCPELAHRRGPGTFS